MFVQDSNGAINENTNNDLSIDTTDIVPYRFKSEQIKSVSPLSRLSPPASVSANKLNEFTRQSANPLRKPAANEISEVHSFQRSNNTILEETSRTSFTDSRSLQSSHSGLLVQQKIVSQQSEGQQIISKNIIYANSSSKTIGELVKTTDQSLSRSHANRQNVTVYETTANPSSNHKQSLTIEPQQPIKQLKENIVVTHLMKAVSPKSNESAHYSDYNNYDDNLTDIIDNDAENSVQSDEIKYDRLASPNSRGQSFPSKNI